MKSQVPKASSRDRLERVKAKLSVVTLLLPKLHLRPGIITQESDNDDDSGNEAKVADALAIDKVAAAQKLFATTNENSSRSSPEDKPNKSVGFRVASPPNARRKGVVSAPKSSLVISSDEQSKNLKNMIDSRRKLSSEPGLIRTSSETNLVDDGQLRKLSSSAMELPRRLQKRMTPDIKDKGSNMLPLPTVEEENTSSSSVIKKNLVYAQSFSEIQIQDGDLSSYYLSRLGCDWADL